MPKAGKKERTLLLIGSSETAAGIYPARILELMKDSGITLAGTVKRANYAPGVVTEGYGGWSYAIFTRSARSPFLREGRLDFKQYVNQKCNGKTPDIITITLGGNDAFGMGYNASEQKLAAILDSAEKLISELRRAGSGSCHRSGAHLSGSRSGRIRCKLWVPVERPPVQNQSPYVDRRLDEKI